MVDGRGTRLQPCKCNSESDPSVTPAHHECVVQVDDVAPQDGGFKFWYVDDFALPDAAHPRDDVIPPDRRDLLAEHLDAPIGQVSMCGHDGGFRDDDARAAVLESGVDADVLALAVALALYLGCDGDAPIRDEHAGEFLLLHSSDRRLETRRSFITFHTLAHQH